MIPAFLLGLCCALAGFGGERFAPDDRPGLGAEATLGELLGHFRSPTDAEEELLAGLFGLEGRLSVLVAATQRQYRDLGYFGLLDPREEESLEALDRYLELLLERPAELLAARDAHAQARARLFLDARFRARSALLEDWRRDARTVTRGLLVLRGCTDGWVALGEEQARNVAARVDLAAALLRARIRDMEALREGSGSPSRVSDAAIDDLLSLVELGQGEMRSQHLAEAMRGVDATAARMLELLFTTRLAERAHVWVRWRDERDRAARTAREEARLWLPGEASAESVPREIKRAKKTDRRREAYRRAQEALSYDPLDEEMAYTAARMARYVSGTLETLSHYDRFLALRGIRLAEGRTWETRQLDEAEEDAILYIQQYEHAEAPPD